MIRGSHLVTFLSLPVILLLSLAVALITSVDDVRAGTFDGLGLLFRS